MNNPQQAQVTPELLARAGRRPAGAKLEVNNPMESIPTLTIGDDLTEGNEIVGRYVESERLMSKKFTYSKEIDPVSGLPVQVRHILELVDSKTGMGTGEKIGIWNTGELKLFFSKRTAGQLVAITYKGKGKNSSGNQQHFFSYEVEGQAQPALN